MTRAPILTLETAEPVRPLVRIDAVDYELTVISDLGVIGQARLFRCIAEAGELQAEIEKVSDDKIPEPTLRRLEALLDESVELVLRAPADVRARLDEGAKRKIVEAFRSTVATATPRTETKRRPPSRSTSAGSRHSSPPSTARAHG